MAVQLAPRSGASPLVASGPPSEPTGQMPGQSAPADTSAVTARDAARDEARRASWRERLAGAVVEAAAKPPFAVIAHVRLVLTVLAAGLCLLTAGGALLLLVAWRQEQTAGLLPSQADRLWDVWSLLATAERYLALAVAPVAAVWFAVAALNVRRASGRRRNPLLSAAAFGGGVAGMWLVGREIVNPAIDRGDWIGAAAGMALQSVFVALPLLVMERLADAAGARHRPARVASVMTLGYLVALQSGAALASIDRTTEIDGWGRTGALVLIAALVQILAVLAFSEAGRALEEGTQHRYELCYRFGDAALVHSRR